jgi:hypothetical protein
MEDQAQYKTKLRVPGAAQVPRIYISGRISGLTPEEVRVKFNRAQEKLYHSCPGMIAVNPLNLHDDLDKSWEDLMAKDLAELLRCEMIYMLPDWHQSRGARIEYAVAKEAGIMVVFE